MVYVPLRPVSQSYVIATSTKLDVSKVDVGKITDNYFKKEVQKKKKSESEFFEAEKEVRIFVFSLYIVSSYHKYKSCLT